MTNQNLKKKWKIQQNGTIAHVFPLFLKKKLPYKNFHYYQNSILIIKFLTQALQKSVLDYRSIDLSFGIIHLSLKLS